MADISATAKRKLNASNKAKTHPYLKLEFTPSIVSVDTDC